MKSVPVSSVTLDALIEIEVANYIEQVKPDTTPEKLIEHMVDMLRTGNNHMTKKAREEFTRFLECFK